MSKFMDWVDARFPATKMWEDHLSKYYAPKNFNFSYFFGSLALLVLGWCGVRSKVITFAGTAFVLGILGFSGSIYAMVLLGSKGLGLITPAGGLCFMLGWAALMWAGCRLGGKNE